jgi:hypothetical protein
MIYRTTLILLLTSLLPACRSASTEGPGADSPTNTTATENTEGESAPGPSATSAGVRDNADDFGEWDPNKPISRNDPRYKQKRTMFAIHATSLCPTKEGAKAEDCGNTVEFPENGYRVGVGDVVHTLGEEPVDGLWRGIRYMKPGFMPAWIRADRLAMEPALGHLQALVEANKSRCEVASAKEADIKAWQAGKKPCLVLTDVDPVEQTSDWVNDRDADFKLTVNGATLEVSYESPDDDENMMPPPFIDIYENGHMYRCDSSYCDRVVYVLEKTDRKDSVRLSHVADRYGLHPGK